MQARPILKMWEVPEKLKEQVIRLHRGLGHVSGKHMVRMLRILHNDLHTEKELEEIVGLCHRLPRCSTCDLSQALRYRGKGYMKDDFIYPDGKLVLHLDLSGKKMRSVRGYYLYAVAILKRREGARMKRVFVKVLILKSKDDIYGKLEEFLIQTANLLGEGVTMCVCDNDTVFVLGEGLEVLKRQGCILCPSSVESQFQNGTSEIHIYLVQVLATKLLHRGCCPKATWCFAVRRAEQLINFRPGFSGATVSMHEGYYKVKVSLKNIIWEMGQVCRVRMTDREYDKVKGNFGLRGRYAKVLGRDTLRPNRYVLMDSKGNLIPPTSNVVLIPNIFNISEALDEKGENFENFEDFENAEAQGEPKKDIGVDIEDSPNQGEQGDMNDDSVNRLSHEQEVENLEKEVEKVENKPIVDTNVELRNLERDARFKTDEDLGVRKSKRTRAPRTSYGHDVCYAKLIDEDYIENAYWTCASEVINTPFHALRAHADPIWRARWIAAQNAEFTKLNDTYKSWRVIKKNNLPNGAKLLKIRVIHTIKYDGDNKFSKCKCRAVIRGFASDYQGQRHSPTVQRISVHIISAMSARLNLIMYTCDIVSAYLLATLLVPQYVEIPKEFRIISPESFTDDDCFALEKATYGLPEAGRRFYQTCAALVMKFTHNGVKMKRLKVDPCVFVWRSKGIILIICLHVDDTKIATNRPRMKDLFIKHLRVTKNWDVHEVGKINYFLSLSYKQDLKNGTVQMNQKGQVQAILDSHEIVFPKDMPFVPSVELAPNEDQATQNTIDECRSLLGKIIYLLWTYPELSFIISKVASLVTNPSDQVRKILYVQILGYLRKTISWHCIQYSKAACYTGGPTCDPALHADGRIKDCGVSVFKIQCFVDAEFGLRCKKTSRSRGGTALMMVNGPIYVNSKVQPIAAASTQEAEYIQMETGRRMIQFVISFLEELEFKQDAPVDMFEDNAAAARLATSLTTNTRSKHILLRHHIIRDEVIEFKKIQMWLTPGMWQLADITTKQVGRVIWIRFVKILLGLVIKDFREESDLIDTK